MAEFVLKTYVSVPRLLAVIVCSDVSYSEECQIRGLSIRGKALVTCFNMFVFSKPFLVIAFQTKLFSKNFQIYLVFINNISSL